MLAQAERKRVSLREKTVKELEGPIKTARADERDKKAAWDAEKAREQKLEKQIPYCKLGRADGRQGGFRQRSVADVGSNRPQIEEGATVRERQIIARIYDPKGPMQINAKVPESEVSRLAPGMTVRVKIDALSGRDLDRPDHRDRPAARPGQLLQPEYQGVYHPGPARQTACASCPGLHGARPRSWPASWRMSSACRPGRWSITATRTTWP